MNLVDVFNIIDIMINYQKYEEIIDKSQKEFIIATSEEDVNHILKKYKKLIDNWYNKIIIKSVFVLLVFTFLSIIFYILCDYFNSMSIFLAIFSLILIADICIITYILDKHNNKTISYPINFLWANFTLL